MTNKSITRSTPAAIAERAEQLRESANRYAQARRSQNTRDAYSTDWEHFEQFTQAMQLQALPADPETVALYVTSLADAGFKISTIERRLVAISYYHKAAGEDSPAKHAGVRELMRGIRNTIKTKPEQKEALTSDNIRTWIETLTDSPADIRDKAIILIGFAGALRRSEIAALDLEDLRFTDRGIILTLKQSKTNQAGEREDVYIPHGQHPETDPVAALRAWLDVSEIREGPLFRRIRSGRYYSDKITSERISAKWISVIVKQICKALGKSEHECRAYSGHSLRAGHITEAITRKAPQAIVMLQSRHKSEAVFREYVRPAEGFEQNSAAYLDL